MKHNSFVVTGVNRSAAGSCERSGYRSLERRNWATNWRIDCI